MTKIKEFILNMVMCILSMLGILILAPVILTIIVIEPFWGEN